MPERISTAQRRLRRAFLMDIRHDGCVLCREPELIVLELHHVEAKKKELTDAIYWDDEETFLAEVAKCVVLCANCHKRVHAKARDVPLTYMPGRQRTRRRWKEFLRRHVVQDGSRSTYQNNSRSVRG